MANNPSIFTGALNGATGGIHERWITATQAVDYTAVRNAVVEFASVIDAMIDPDVQLGLGAGSLMQTITQGVLAQRYITIADDFSQIARAIVALWRAVVDQQEPFDPAYPPPGGGLLRVPVDGGMAQPINGTANGNIWYYDNNNGLWLPSGAPSDNQVPVWNAGTNQYDFREYVSPGELEYFDLVSNTVGLWNFDNTIVDFSGNGFDLSAIGTLGFSNVYPGKVGVMVGGGNLLQYAPTGTVLGITEDMTLEMILQPTDDALGSFIQYAASGETLATNALWGLGSNGGSSASVNRRLVWTSEHDAGIDDSTTSAGTMNIGYIHNLQYIAATRIANVIRFYYNGIQVGPASVALTTPNGGTSSRLIFGNATPSAPIPSIIYSTRIQNTGRDSTFIRNSYNRTMGPAFGRIAA